MLAFKRRRGPLGVSFLLCLGVNLDGTRSVKENGTYEYLSYVLSDTEKPVTALQDAKVFGRTFVGGAMLG